MAGDRCRLLELPAELRIEIYELSFAPYDDKEVNFLAIRPPSNALLQTCRHIFSESRSLYRQAFRAYWTESKFVIGPMTGGADGKVLDDKIAALRDVDLDNISDLRLSHSRTSGDTMHCELLPNGHGWYMRVRLSDPSNGEEVKKFFLGHRVEKSGPTLYSARVDSREEAIRRAAEATESATRLSMRGQLRILR